MAWNPQLKGKQRQTLSVALSEEERRQYDRIRLEDRPIFARLGALRQLLEQVKVRVIIELLAELDIEDKVILFCEFKETVSILRGRVRKALFPELGECLENPGRFNDDLVSLDRKGELDALIQA